MTDRLRFIDFDWNATRFLILGDGTGRHVATVPNYEDGKAIIEACRHAADSAELRDVVQLWVDYWSEHEAEPLDAKVGTALVLMMRQLAAAIRASSDTGSPTDD